MSLNNDSHSALALAADGLLPQAIDSAPPPGKSDLLPVLPSNANLATPSEQWFDDLALLACEICHTPMALVSLVVAEPHWFKSRAGAEIAKAVHAVAFCSDGLPQRDVLIIPDAALDERFASHPLITGSPGIRFIAGVPLVTTEGHGLGTFYVIDQVAQQLTTAQLAALRALGRQAVTQLELRRCLLDQEELSPAAKRVSPTLRENEAPENAILESVSDCIVTFNQEGNLIGFNPAAERTFGYPRAAVLGKNILTLFVSPTGYERPPQELARCLRAGTGSAMNQRIELTALHSDGTVFPVEFSFIRVGLAEPAQYTGLIRDISDRKCLLAALQAERDLLTVTLNCIPDAIIAVDTAGRVQLLGGKAEQLTGWKAASAIGRPLTEVFELLDGGGGLVVDLMAEVQRHGSPVGNIHSLEKTHVQKSAAGNHRMIALCALPLCHPAGKVHGALVVFREVTAELEAARLRQDFMHMASHELRTPLTAIRGFIDTIQADPAMPVPTIRSFLTIVHEQAQRLHHLLNDILEVSRIEAGNLQYEDQPLQLGDLVARTLAQLAPSAALRQLLVESTVAADLPEFRGDAERLQSVMTNLLSNAIKFTPDGGKIALELGTENGHFRFAVRDTGVGIALEHQKRVFDKFYRVIRTGQQVPGSGLGLTKVRAVVEHYGGRVQVESKVGQGSCFTVFLPLTTVHQAQAQRTGFG